jgi:nicotinamidase-related amidase
MRDGVDRFLPGIGESVLVVVDVQDRLAAVMEGRERVVQRTKLLIEGAKILGLPIILTEQYPKGLGPTVSEIREVLPPEVRPVEKLHFSCCGEPAFMDALKKTGRTKVLLAGMETHICVLQTTLCLIAAGYTVHVVSDAVCSRKRSDYEVGLGIAREAGAVVTSAETVLFQLLKKAGTEEFKSISKLVK